MNRRLQIAAVIATLGLVMTMRAIVAQSAGAAQLSADQRAAISFECSETIIGFFARLDALNRRLALGAAAPAISDDPWDLATADAVWERGGGVIASRSDFAAAIRALPKGLLTSHQVVNFLVQSIDAQLVTARFSVTIYDAIYQGEAGTPLLGAPDAILGVQVSLKSTPAGWRIRRMTSDRLFYRPPDSSAKVNTSSNSNVLLSPEDYIGIQQLYGMYARDVDPGSIRDPSWMFTKDAVVIMGGAKPMVTPEEIKAFYSGVKVRQADGGGVRHFNSSYVIVGTPDGGARGSSYMMQIETKAEGGHPEVTLFGKYEDKLVKTPDGWRIKERVWKADTFRGSRLSVVASPIPGDRRTDLTGAEVSTAH